MNAHTIKPLALKWLLFLAAWILLFLSFSLPVHKEKQANNNIKTVEVSAEYKLLANQ